MKRTPLKKKSPKKISVLKRKLWDVFSKYIRARDKNTCFTCGRTGTGSGIHAGHFIPKSVGGITLYFHPENVHAQCYNCNINLGGNQWEYGQRLGAEKVAFLQGLRGKIEKWDEARYEWEINWYKQLLAELA